MDHQLYIITYLISRTLKHYLRALARVRGVTSAALGRHGWLSKGDMCVNFEVCEIFREVFFEFNLAMSKTSEIWS